MSKVFPDKIIVLFVLFLSYLSPPLAKVPVATRTVIDHHFNCSSFSHSFQELPFIRHEQHIKTTQFDPNEKFLTFFTHSGIQNQLIQVENGILLAWYLNRTLILPRAVLGKAFGWGTFERLHEQHIMRDKHIDCKKLSTDSPLKCPNKKKYTLVPFDELFDLSFAKQHVKIITRDFSEPDWLENTLGINDVLYFKGQSRYDWRIFDMPLKHKFLGKYSDSLEMDQLRSRDEKLIHFTTLFGTGKLPARRPEHLEFLEKLGKSITYKHPAVLEISEKIVQALGGAGNFIGVHLRTSDGLFVNAIPENISKISKKIEQHTSSQVAILNQTLNKHELFSQCVSLAKSKQTTLVFLATDASHPQQYSELYQTTRCIFTLHDILDDEHPAWNSIIDQHRTSHTGESMKKYLVPLVDGLVSSRGYTFIGTEGSTFSGYVRRLHDTFWNN